MLNLKPILLAAALMAAGAYQPARLRTGSVDRIPFTVASAGLVMLDVTVNERGAVSEVRMIKDVDPFGSMLKTALGHWEFEPARQDGQAVESQILVAGLFRPPMLLFPAPAAPRPPDVEPPRSIPYPTSVSVPPYPPNRLGDGIVLVEVEVGEDGAVGNARVVGSAGGFDDAALQTARAWKFRPARDNGQSVRARAYLVFAFRWPT